MEKKQTAIEWLYKITKQREPDKFDWEQAKQMEKEQIEDAYQEGKWDWHNHITNGTESKDLAQYYNETYKNLKKINNMDRIQINGVWYVRETEPQEEIELNMDNITQSITILYENDDYVWEARRIYKEDGETLYDGVDIEFTNRRIQSSSIEYWDNMNWFKGILENNPESMREAIISMNDEGIKHFKLFLKYLKDKNWL